MSLKRKIRPVERQPMREWLLDHLNSEEHPGLTWVDKDRGTFKIKWCHGSRHGWTKRDIDVFEQWAKHTGRHYYGKERDEKKWKANFRCALNSLKCVTQVNKTLRGQNAFREYQFVNPMTAGKNAKIPGEGTKRKFKKIKQEIEETVDTESDYDAEDNSDREDNSSNQELNVTVQKPTICHVAKSVTLPGAALPHFNKISPGLVPSFEYGKPHTIKKHNCGFIVSQIISGQQKETVSSDFSLVRQQSGTYDSGYNCPDTPEDSVGTDTEVEQSEMDMFSYAQTIEITTSEDHTQYSSDGESCPENHSYSDHFPLTPPYEVTIYQDKSFYELSDADKTKVILIPSTVDQVQ